MQGHAARCFTALMTSTKKHSFHQFVVNVFLNSVCMTERHKLECVTYIVTSHWDYGEGHETLILKVNLQ